MRENEASATAVARRSCVLARGMSAWEVVVKGRRIERRCRQIVATLACWLCLIVSIPLAMSQPPAVRPNEPTVSVTNDQPLYAALLDAIQVTPLRLEQLASAGFTSIVLRLNDNVQQQNVEHRACQQILDAKFKLFYWIEVARSPTLADSHPEWMASLQGHQEWRRLFSAAPVPGNGEVVKTYPWVPILNKEPFDAQWLRVRAMLDNRPPPHGVFLNDLQGAPSACGCGNNLCRWTSDYGELRSVTPLEPSAAAEFVAQVQQLLPSVEIIPVWTTECEEHDGTVDGHCAGVGCFEGICWRAYTKQLAPVADACARIGVLLPYLAFDRDQPSYGVEAGWIRHAIESFQSMPVRHGESSIGPTRLIAVLQGWDVTDRQVAQQVAVAGSSGVASVIVAFCHIDQSWQPWLSKTK